MVILVVRSPQGGTKLVFFNLRTLQAFNLNFTILGFEFLKNSLPTPRYAMVFMKHEST